MNNNNFQTMNSIPMFITLPYAQQPITICPQPTFPSFVFVMAPLTSNQQTQEDPFKINSNSTTISSLKTQNSNYQQRYIRTNNSMKKDHINDMMKLQKNKHRYRIQRLRDNKGRYYGVRKVIVKEKYKQNPKRNVVTNIGNQLLSFIANRSKSLQLVKKINNTISEGELSQFYAYIYNLRKVTDYYLNINKLKSIWYPQSSDSNQLRDKNLSLLRSLSYIYLNNMIHLFVLNSGKIKSSSKIFHIKAIRALLDQLAPRKEI